MVKSLFLKGYRMFKSMKFGLVLLAVLGIISAVGSLIPQGNEPIFYINNFSPAISKAILIVQMDNIYNSKYFLILFTALCLNLFLCSISRIGLVIKKLKKLPDYTQMKKDGHFRNHGNETLSRVFEDYGFKKHTVTNDGDRTIHYGRKNIQGYLGSWLIHLGILIIILFYTYGQLTYFSTAIYGVAGITATVEGTALQAKINSFNIHYRDDGSIGQYVTNIDLFINGEKELKSQDISVNNPLSYKGYRFYQNSTGWASKVNLYKKEERIGTNKLLYQGMGYEVVEENIAIQFLKFYPDFHANESGFHSDSDDFNNPKILYVLYYRGRRVDMNITDPGSPIVWNEYEVIFETPQRYTYLQVNKMEGKLGALIGSLLMTIGLILAFYMKPQELVMVDEGDYINIFCSNNVKSLTKKSIKSTKPPIKNFPLQQ